MARVQLIGGGLTFDLQVCVYGSRGLNSLQLTNQLLAFTQLAS